MQPEPKKARDQALGHSRGGQVSDVTHAQALIEGIKAEAVRADKGD